VFGDHSAEASAVDHAVGGAIVELCLKMTETELKSFLLRLAEWRDVVFTTEAADDWRSRARSVSYYSLVDCLIGKLKTLFIPFMGHLWEHAAEQLKLFEALVMRRTAKSNEVDDGTTKKKKSKKRSLAEGTSVDPSSSSDQLLVEMKVLVLRILNSVTQCCTQDSSGFITEVSSTRQWLCVDSVNQSHHDLVPSHQQRYEDMTPPLLSLLPLVQAFDTEASYLAFCESQLVPALTSLSISVGRDLLWKPLNHQVLLLTRDGRKAVRMAAVTALHCLFKEVRCVSYVGWMTTVLIPC
jgi:U3 small nucleolar RNA-associated protein 10